MRFGVLGPLAVWTADGAPVRVPEAKVRALLANLLLHEGRPVSTGRLVDDLWGDRPPGNAGNTLQTKISQLRRTLERAEPGGGRRLVHQPAGYLLRVERDEFDARRFRDLTGRARTTADPRARAALLTDALDLWRGAAFADFDEEPFAETAILRLEEDRLIAVEDRIEARLELGEHGVLVGELTDLIARHPLRERPRGLQMRALYRSGRQTEALNSYADLRKRLVEELGVDPGPELADLRQAILRQEVTSPPPASAPRPRSNLPAPLTELVGRETAVRSVRSLISEARLVTLTGPGGVGKTRLAVETARRTEAASGGVWIVELAGLDRRSCAEHSCSAGDWVVEMVAAVLGVRQDPGGGLGAGSDRTALVDRLAEALSASETLLVLDNCERVVAAVASVAERLLGRAAGLRILATSQEPLGLGGEVLWTVPPLAVPEEGMASVASMRGVSGVELFVARAAAASPGFVLDEDTAAAVGAICRRLDGVPLALELAATRVRALGVQELLRRLDDRFGVLTTGHRDAPARHRTLRAMIDWSWEHLSAPERAVLRRLAVHADGCTLEAAEEVCSADGVAPGEVVDLLARLVDRSLVVREERGGASRYRLLETVVVYCLERLGDAGEFEWARRRHADYYTEFTERAQLRGPDQPWWLDRLDAEAANVRSALDTLVQDEDADSALRLTMALAWYYFLRGRLREAQRSLRAALAIPRPARTDSRSAATVWCAAFGVLAGEPRPTLAGQDEDRTAVELLHAINDVGTRSRAGWFLGYVATTVGDMRTGASVTRKALADFEATDDEWGTAAALCDRANQATHQGNLDQAERDASRSAELFDRLGDRWGQLQASFVVGSLAEITGQYDRAARVHVDGSRMAEELGLWPEVSFQLSWLGRIALLRGQYDQANEFHGRAMRLAAERAFKPGEMYAQTGLALGARRAGDLDPAEEHLHAVLRWHNDERFGIGSHLILDELGFLAEQRGDGPGARRFHEDALTLAHQSGDPRARALGMEGLAGVHTLEGDHRRAARLLGASDATRTAVGAPLPEAERGDVDRITEAATTALGVPAFDVEFQRGTAMPATAGWPDDGDYLGLPKEPETVSRTTDIAVFTFSQPT